MAKQYGLVFDLRRCTGCFTCITACKAENDLDRGYSWMKVLTRTSGKYPQLAMHWEPMTCMQCQQPPCVDSCPLSAISKREDGVVLIDQSQCNGCQACLTACPYDAIRFNSAKDVADKCTLCAPRIEQGLPPYCVNECTGGAIHFGDVNDPHSEVSRLIATRRGYVMQPEKDTRPAVYYLPP